MKTNDLKKVLYAVSVTLSLLFVSCHPTAKKVRDQPFRTTVQHPEWSRKAVLYEVNIRQYTSEGTFRAFEEHLPRLKALGVDILWLMPIYPIGKTNRKGQLGSYYSIRDYVHTNPEYGSINDLKHLVAKAHAMGFHVLLDWVANHTAWDHTWTKTHPDWYEHDSTGHFVSPYDWTDVIQLNYSNHHLWAAMVNDMKFWINKTDIDGFRCDYPGHIPVAFWDSARSVLQSVKPVFMLAEDEEHTALLEHSFDMNYAWELMHLTEHIAQGKDNASALSSYFLRQQKIYPPDAYRLNCITNHDENSWNGTVFERYGKGVKAFAILDFTVPGMPLIYSGQEAGLNKKLRFFDKDTIPWNDTTSWSPFYRQLIQLKHSQQALWNGNAGGKIEILPNNKEDQVFSFIRKKGSDKVLVIQNLSSNKIKVTIHYRDQKDIFTEYFSGQTTEIGDSCSFQLFPWRSLVYTSNP
ncbi:MAG: alpha-amylase [Bacteroidales bacterium]|nr:alpha-amylase [Bacteroidales bacterium]